MRFGILVGHSLYTSVCADSAFASSPYKLVTFTRYLSYQNSQRPQTISNVLYPINMAQVFDLVTHQKLGQLVYGGDSSFEPEVHIAFDCEACGVTIYTRNSFPKMNYLHFRVYTTRSPSPDGRRMTTETFRTLCNDLTTLVDLNFAVSCLQCHTMHSVELSPDSEMSIGCRITKSCETWRVQPIMTWVVAPEIAWLLNKRAGINVFFTEIGDDVGHSTLAVDAQTWRARALHWASHRFEGASGLYSATTIETWNIWLRQVFPETFDQSEPSPTPSPQAWRRSASSVMGRLDAKYPRPRRSSVLGTQCRKRPASSMADHMDAKAPSLSDKRPRLWASAAHLYCADEVTKLDATIVKMRGRVVQPFRIPVHETDDDGDSSEDSEDSQDSQDSQDSEDSDVSTDSGRDDDELGGKKAGLEPFSSDFFDDVKGL